MADIQARAGHSAETARLAEDVAILRERAERARARAARAEASLRRRRAEPVGL